MKLFEVKQLPDVLHITMRSVVGSGETIAHKYTIVVEPELRELYNTVFNSRGGASSSAARQQFKKTLMENPEILDDIIYFLNKQRKTLKLKKFSKSDPLLYNYIANIIARVIPI